MNATNSTPADRAAGAIKRRIRVRGPQTLDDLWAALPYPTRAMEAAIKHLRTSGEIHVYDREERDGPGMRKARFGLAGLHPREPSNVERVEDCVRDAHPEPVWPIDACYVVGMSKDTFRLHAERLVKAGVLRRVNGPGRRVRYALGGGGGITVRPYLNHKRGNAWTRNEMEALRDDVAKGLTSYAEAERALGLKPDTLKHRVKVLCGESPTHARRREIVLECVEAFGPLTAQDLADELHWTQRTARRWLARLEEDGAVVRQVPPSGCGGHRWRLRGEEE